MRPRSLARRLALQYLYMIDLIGRPRAQDLESFLDDHAEDAGVRAFAGELVESVLSKQGLIDERLRKVATNWSLERIAVVERNVLRIGCAELLDGRVPVKVALDEAIRLGKRFGSRDSGSFINGILDRVREAGDPSPGGGA